MNFWALIEHRHDLLRADTVFDDLFKNPVMLCGQFFNAFLDRIDDARILSHLLSSCESLTAKRFSKKVVYVLSQRPGLGIPLVKYHKLVLLN
jgi:hypothetical protein